MTGAISRTIVTVILNGVKNLQEVEHAETKTLLCVQNDKMIDLSDTLSDLLGPDHFFIAFLSSSRAASLSSVTKAAYS